MNCYRAGEACEESGARYGLIREGSQERAPKLVAGSNSGLERPVGRMEAEQSRSCSRPDPGAAFSVPSATIDFAAPQHRLRPAPHESARERVVADIVVQSVIRERHLTIRIPDRDVGVCADREAPFRG